ncbi:class I SAM-dependent methyltransferase [Crenobacter intestini]|uniref:SAM-dependent methyltransferase n=1 Tax=Crenobacter intestini TaxID=2563443 RepID=A0A4T0UXB2_9NEIS|nr:SAM-dependent methyltransferase [Crenobacter intestini]TIC83764.1 SAM-dependent methyltransferase [Crenobacter intestini]
MAKDYEIRPEQSVELLKELHILTRDGKLNQDSRRKLKQVYHLVQFIEPLIREVVADKGDVTVVDHGAGKSYLGFILYDLVLKALEVGEVIGIETREELVATTAALAERLGFTRMRFINETVAESISNDAIGKQVDIVTALHACNTATDDAIRFALQKDARFIVLVPCCQAEVAAELRRVKAKLLAGTPLGEIVRHGIHTREFGSQLTNVLRCLLLEAHGYQLTVTELVGWEHSMKNELIVAKKGQRRGGARERAEALLESFMLDGLRGRFIY